MTARLQMFVRNRQGMYLKSQDVAGKKLQARFVWNREDADSFEWWLDAYHARYKLPPVAQDSAVVVDQFGSIVTRDRAKLVDQHVAPPKAREKQS
jgi:hypothetical protein